MVISGEEWLFHPRCVSPDVPRTTHDPIRDDGPWRRTFDMNRSRTQTQRTTILSYSV